MKSDRTHKARGDSKDFCTGLKYNSRQENMNGFEEGVEFLPVNNAKKVEKRGPRRWVVLVALLIGFLLISLAVGLLVWHFQYRNMRVQKIFNGYLRITNENFVDAYEDSNSTEFKSLASKVKEALKLIYSEVPVLGPYHKKSIVTAFSEGSVIAYYWSEFSIPQHLEEEAELAMAKERSLPPKARALQSFVLTSVVAFRESGADRVWAHEDQSAEEWSWGKPCAWGHCIGEDSCWAPPLR